MVVCEECRGIVGDSDIRAAIFLIMFLLSPPIIPSIDQIL